MNADPENDQKERKQKQSNKESEQRCRACATFVLWKLDSVEDFRFKKHDLHVLQIINAHPESCYKCKDYVTCKILHLENQTKTKMLPR